VKRINNKILIEREIFKKSRILFSEANLEEFLRPIRVQM